MTEKTKADKLISQAQLAKEHGVARKTVTVWKNKGYLVFSATKIDREKSNRKLKSNRLGKYKDQDVTPTVTPHEGNSVALVAEEVTTLWGDPTEWRGITQAEADRRKAIELAYFRHLQNEKETGKLVEVSAVEREQFRLARTVRDNWSGFPARVGPLIASELGIDPAQLHTVLEKYVRDELAQQSAKHLRGAG